MAHLCTPIIGIPLVTILAGAHGPVEGGGAQSVVSTHWKSSSVTELIFSNDANISWKSAGADTFQCGSRRAVFVLVAVLVDETLVWEEVWCVHIHVILLDTWLGQGHTWHQLGRPHPVLESPPAVLDGPGLVPGPGRSAAYGDHHRGRRGVLASRMGLLLLTNVVALLWSIEILLSCLMSMSECSSRNFGHTQRRFDDFNSQTSFSRILTQQARHQNIKSEYNVFFENLTKNSCISRRFITDTCKTYASLTSTQPSEESPPTGYL